MLLNMDILHQRPSYWRVVTKFCRDKDHLRRMTEDNHSPQELAAASDVQKPTSYYEKRFCNVKKLGGSVWEKDDAAKHFLSNLNLWESIRSGPGREGRICHAHINTHDGGLLEILKQQKRLRTIRKPI